MSGEEKRTPNSDDTPLQQSPGGQQTDAHGQGGDDPIPMNSQNAPADGD